MTRDDDHLLLLSEFILEKKMFGSDARDYKWKDCELRKWLNSDFYASIFNSEEQKYIQRMITSEDTDDLVFCLSAEEARSLFMSDEARVAYVTTAAKNNGFSAFDDVGGWWTRSVSTAQDGKGVVPVEASGEVRSAGCVPYYDHLYTDMGIRPAICVCLSEADSKAQNMTLFGWDSMTGLDNEPNPWGWGTNPSHGTSHSHGAGTSSDYGKCSVCNGTGYVRYYYGESALEAWLSGHEDYTVGKCTSCGGTGKIG